MDSLAAFASGVPAFGRTGSALRAASGSARQCCCTAPLTFANLWAIDPGVGVAWTKLIDVAVLDIDTDSSGNVYVLAYQTGSDPKVIKYSSAGALLASSTISVGFSVFSYSGFISVNAGYVAAVVGNQLRFMDTNLAPLNSPPQRTLASTDSRSLVTSADGGAWVGLGNGYVDVGGIVNPSPRVFSGNSTRNTGIALNTMSSAPAYVYQVNADSINRLSVKQIGGAQSSQNTNAHYGLARRNDGTLVTGRANGSVEQYTVGGLSSWTLANTWSTGAASITNVRTDSDTTGAVGAADADGKTAFMIDSAGTVTFRWAIDSDTSVVPLVAKPSGTRLYVGGYTSNTWQQSV